MDIIARVFEILFCLLVLLVFLGSLQSQQLSIPQPFNLDFATGVRQSIKPWDA